MKIPYLTALEMEVDFQRKLILGGGVKEMILRNRHLQKNKKSIANKSNEKTNL